MSFEWYCAVGQRLPFTGVVSRRSTLSPKTRSASRRINGSAMAGTDTRRHSVIQLVGEPVARPSACLSVCLPGTWPKSRKLFAQLTACDVAASSEPHGMQNLPGHQLLSRPLTPRLVDGILGCDRASWRTI